MSRCISMIMMLFLIFGAADKVIFHGRFKLGNEFVKGLETMGPLTLSMAGIMCIAPVLGKVLAMAAVPFFSMFGIDPAMAAGTFFSLDMGGFPLAKSMTEDPDILMLSGVLLSSTLGGTIIFTIPVSMEYCREEDLRSVSKGMVIGVIAIPAGLVAGGAAAGFLNSYFWLNSAPVFIVCAVLALLLSLFPEQTLGVFKIFGSGIKILCMAGFVLAALEEILGIVIVPGMDALGDQLQVIGLIGVTLAGAYPMVSVINRLLAPCIERWSKLLNVDSVAVSGMLACLANPLPLFDRFREMNHRGKVLSMAFAVPAMAVFGDHLGYITAAMPEGMLPMIAAKLAGGGAALCLACIFEREK